MKDLRHLPYVFWKRDPIGMFYYRDTFVFMQKKNKDGLELSVNLKNRNVR